MLQKMFIDNYVREKGQEFVANAITNCTGYCKARYPGWLNLARRTQCIYDCIKESENIWITTGFKNALEEAKEKAEKEFEDLKNTSKPPGNKIPCPGEHCVQARLPNGDYLDYCVPISSAGGASGALADNISCKSCNTGPEFSPINCDKCCDHVSRQSTCVKPIAPDMNSAASTAIHSGCKLGCMDHNAV